MFRITCNYGTDRTTWSMREALEWLAACGPVAEIRNRLTGRVVRTRRVG